MSPLALLGGAPIRTAPLPGYSSLGPEETAAVEAVMRAGRLSDFIGAAGAGFLGGETVRRFENQWAAHFRTRHAISVNSNTSGLYAAIGAAGVAPGDHVIVSPYSMSASATAPLAWGAIPVFADIDPDTFCLAPQSIRAKITPKTRAIVAVDILGHPADFDAIMAIADEHGLIVIEDAAQCPDAEHRGRKAGTLGHMGVFSLNYHKHIHTGEGGVIVTDDDRLAHRLQMIRNHGEAAAAGMTRAQREDEELVNMIGQNYRMTEIQAAIGVEQLKKLPRLVDARIRQAETLTARLADNPLLAAPVVKDGVRHVYYGYAIKLRPGSGLKRDVVSQALAAEGIANRAGYLTPLYMLPLYQKRIAMGAGGFPFTLAPEIVYTQGLCPVVERIEESEMILMLGVHGQLGERDLRDIGDACEKIAGNIDALRAL